MGMRIRKYTSADLSELKSITAEAFAGVSVDWLIERQFGVLGTDWVARKTAHIDADVATNADGVLVAVDDSGAVTGYVTCHLDTATRLGRIANLAVRADCRGHGLGRSLIRAALDYFRENGMTHAKIETLANNAVGAHLYSDMGFQEMGRQIHYAMALPRP